MNPRSTATTKMALLASFCLSALYILAPWPGPQAVVHVFIVLGLAPELRTYLNCALLAAIAGWILELSLRTYSGMGGTPTANMLCALLLWYSLYISPPERNFGYYIQLVLSVILHTFITYFLVNIAAGPHVMGYGWQWSLALLPLWGPLAWHFYKPPHMR